MLGDVQVNKQQMDEYKHNNKPMSLHQRSKTIIMQSQQLPPIDQRSKSVVRTSSRTLSYQPFTKTRKKELLKIYDIDESEIPAVSPLNSAFPSIKSGSKSVSVNSHALKSRREIKGTFRRHKKAKRRIDNDRTYLLDQIIVDFMYNNPKTLRQTEIEEPQSQESSPKKRAFLPSIYKRSNSKTYALSSIDLRHSSNYQNTDGLESGI